MSPNDDTESKNLLQRSEKLNETNYYVWKQKMEMILQIRDLWEVVKSGVSSGDQQGSQKSLKAKAIIGLTLADSQLVHIRNAKTAQEAWDKLEKVHAGRNLMRRLRLRREFFSLKKSDEESIQQYINKISELRDKLTAIGQEIPRRTLRWQC
jgi:CHAD domain-containing protein